MKYLLTSDKCRHCKKARQKFKDQLERGEIRELPVETDKGFKLAKKLNIEDIPTLVECNGRLRKCKILF